MSRLTPEIAQCRARLARPLSDFTPPQRRLLLALIEAGTAPPSPHRSLRTPRQSGGTGRP